ncbi:MAG: hypothetical protein ABW137_35825 [Mycobacterium sp.]
MREFADQLEQFLAQVGKGIRDGSIRHREDVVEGFEKTHPSFAGPLRGANFGKLIVHISD